MATLTLGESSEVGGHDEKKKLAERHEIMELAQAGLTDREIAEQIG